MITIDDLKAAIAECEGERNPNANTCMKLSAYYTLLKEKQREPEKTSYSHDPAPVIPTVSYYSETEFGKIIENKETSSVLKVIDEVMTVLQAIRPKMYNGIIRKLNEI